MLKSVVRRTPKRRVRDDGWRLPDALWAKMERLLPGRPKHPLGVPQSARAGPSGDGRDLLRAAHRLPVERAARDDDLLLLLGSSALPGMGYRRGVRDLLAQRPACL